MKTFLRIVIRFYGYLLGLYPRSYRDEFAQEMLLDFSDLARDASQKGNWALALFYLRELIDFPINLLRVHSRENHMTPVFHSGPVRGAFQGAFALGIALAAMMSVTQWMLLTLQGEGWLFFLRIAKLHGWLLNYSLTARMIIYFSTVTIGALLAGILLAFCLREAYRIRHYLLFGVLGWAAPLVLVRIIVSLLKTNDESLFNAVLQLSWIILSGLGFGAVFSLILQDRKKTPWLLLAGVLGYYAVTSLTRWILTPWLFPINMPSSSSLWNDLALIAGVYGVQGIVLGAILGIIAGWSSLRVASA